MSFYLETDSFRLPEKEEADVEGLRAQLQAERTAHEATRLELLNHKARHFGGAGTGIICVDAVRGLWVSSTRDGLDAVRKLFDAVDEARRERDALAERVKGLEESGKGYTGPVAYAYQRAETLNRMWQDEKTRALAAEQRAERAQAELAEVRRKTLETVGQHNTGHSPCNCVALRAVLLNTSAPEMLGALSTAPKEDGT